MSRRHKEIQKIVSADALRQVATTRILQGLDEFRACFSSPFMV